MDTSSEEYKEKFRQKWDEFKKFLKEYNMCLSYKDSKIIVECCIADNFKFEDFFKELPDERFVIRENQN